MIKLKQRETQMDRIASVEKLWRIRCYLADTYYAPEATTWRTEDDRDAYNLMNILIREAGTK